MKRLIPVLVFLMSCGMPKAGDTLGEAVRRYNEGVRWERFEVAAIHIPSKQRVRFVDESDDRAKDLKITQYDIVAVEPKGDHAAKVHIKVEWYKDSEGTLHETHAMQTWEKHGGDWLMVDDVRLRGVEMPGLPEPVSRVGHEPAGKPAGGPTSMKD